MAAKRTHRQRMADDYGAKRNSHRQSKSVKRDDMATTDASNLFSGIDDSDNDIPDDEYMASAFIGRMQKTYVYDDIVKPYADNRGSGYDIINRQMKELYKLMAYQGTWRLDKLLTVMIMILKSNQDMTRWKAGRFGGMYDRGEMPLGVLKGITSKDFDYIVHDALERRE